VFDPNIRNSRDFSEKNVSDFEDTSLQSVLLEWLDPQGFIVGREVNEIPK